MPAWWSDLLRQDAPLFHPLLPLGLRLPPTPPTTPPRDPVRQRPGTCALPEPGAASAQPPFAVGYDAHAWSDHYAWLSAPNPRGQRIFCQRWLPLHQNSEFPGNAEHQNQLVWLPWHRSRRRRQADSPKGVIHVIHGLNDNSTKYRHLAKQLVRAGYAVVAHDAHGHGRSDGFRGHADSVQHYVDDARLAVADGHRRLPRRLQGLPKFLLGHSLGGAVAIHLARDSKPGEWAGVLLTAPAVQVYPKPLLKFFAPIIATVAPLMPVQRLKFDRKPRSNQRPRSDWYSRLRSVLIPKSSRTRRPDLETDPLVIRSPVRARLGYEVLKSCQRIMRLASAFRSPVFVAHSKDDRVTNARGSIRFYERIGSKDKTVKVYQGSAHDLLVESGKRRAIVQDMVSWADERAALVRKSGLS